MTLKKIFLALLLGISISTTAFSEEFNKIVIFYSSIGMGHISAARAIEARIKEKDPKSVVILKDIRDFMPETTRKWKEKSFWFVVKRFPELFDKLFLGAMKEGNQVPELTLKDKKDSYNPEELKDYILNLNPTRILSTHYGSTESIIKLRKEGYIKHVPVAWLHTDYFEGYFPRISKQIEHTFLGISSLMDRWRQRGVDMSTVSLTGIPVNPKIYEEVDREEVLKENNLDSSKKIVVLASGGEGVGNYPEIVKSIYNSIKNGDKNKIQFVAITAKNKEHFEALTKLKNEVAEYIDLRVEGFIPNEKLINLVKISDLYITKSGGLSPTEGFIINKPIILLDVYGGHERDNALEFERLNMAIVNRDQSKIGSQVSMIFEDNSLIKKMIKAQLKFRNSLSLKGIVDFVFTDHSQIMTKKLGAFPIGLEGFEHKEFKDSAKKALEALNAESPADVEILLGYGKSYNGKYFERNGNPFGHLGLRIGNTVYTANGRARAGEENTLFHRTSLEEYLYGTKRPLMNAEHTDTFGDSYGRDTISLRISGVSKDEMLKMITEADNIDNKWRKGEISWDKKACNCADFVELLLRAGGFETHSEPNSKLKKVTMPLDIFDNYFKYFSTRRVDLISEMIFYQYVPDSKNAYRTNRFPLSIYQLKRSVRNLLFKRVDPAETQVSKRISFYPGDTKAHYENLKDIGERETPIDIPRPNNNELNAKYEETIELEKQIIRAKQELYREEISNSKGLFENLTNELMNVMSEDSKDEILSNRKTKIEKYLNAINKIQKDTDRLIQMELEWLLASTYKFLLETYANLYSPNKVSPEVKKQQVKLWNALKKAENNYKTYLKNKSDYGKPHDGINRTQPFRNFFAISKTFIDIVEELKSTHPKSHTTVWNRLKARSVNTFNILSIIAKLTPDLVKTVFHLYFNNQSQPGEAPINVAANRMIEKLRELSNISVSINNKEHLPKVGPLTGKTIYIVAPNHSHPIHDAMIMSQLGLEKAMIVLAPDQSFPKFLADKLDASDTYVSVGRGRDKPLQQVLEQLEKGKTNTILIYPEGSAATGMGETRPLREKFEWGLVHALQNAGYKINLIPVTYENTSGFLHKNTVGHFFKTLGQNAGLTLKATVHKAIGNDSITFLKDNFKANSLNQVIRAIWTEHLDSIEGSEVERLRPFSEVVKKLREEVQLSPVAPSCKQLLLKAI